VDSTVLAISLETSVLCSPLDNDVLEVLSDCCDSVGFVPYPAVYPSTGFEPLLNYLIPGLGTKTNNKCNTIVGADYCPNGHTLQPIAYHCKNWNCPECFPWAASRAARRVSDRLDGVLMAWDSIGKRPGNINHIELSVPPEEYGNFDPKKYKPKAIRYAKQIGVSGGVIIFHPGRVKDQYKAPIMQAFKVLGEKNPRYWKGVQKNILGLKSWCEYLDFGPHYHILGYFTLLERSDKFYQRTHGWTYKNISYSKRKGPEDKDSVYSIARYLLTHHSIESGKQGYAYFGIASNNKVLKTTTRETEYLKCPECLEQMYRIAISSDKQFNDIKEGKLKVDVHEHISRSKVTLVRNWYTVKMKQAKIVPVETQYIEDYSGSGGDPYGC